MSKPKIPSIPSIQHIQDPHTRKALQALLDAWAVRNGQTGEEGARFVTRDELDGFVQSQRVGPTVRYGSASEGEFARGGIVGSFQGAVQQIIADIQNSALWRKLSARIDKLDGPGGVLERIGLTETGIARYVNETDSKIEVIEGQLVSIDDNIAAVVDTKIAEVTPNFATAQSVTDLQTTVNGASLNAQNALSIAQGVDGSIDASWTVKFDADGYVVGAGLGLEGKDGTYTSQFLVRADRFAVGSPTSPNLFPFIVDSSSGSPLIALNGQVYIGARTIQEVADNAAVPVINHIGSFATAPSITGLKKNTTYKNTTNGNTYIIEEEGAPWVLWLEKGAKGDAGDPGFAGDSVDIVFRRSASQPATPAASAGVPAGWYSDVASVPAGADPIWSSVGTKASGAATYTWQTPIKIQGSDGASGLSIVELTIFKRTTASETPTGGTYNFATKTLTPPSGWSIAVPSGTNPVYTSRATVSSSNPSATSVAVSGWTASVVSFQNGANGTNGTNGSNGSDGARGSLTGYGANYGISSSSWNASQAQAVIYNMVYGSSMTSYASTGHLRIGDTVTLSNGSTFAETRYWGGSSWLSPGVVIDGNLLVNGTVSANYLNVGTTSGGVSVGYINPGSGTKTNGIYVYQNTTSYYGLFVENKAPGGGAVSFKSTGGYTLEVNNANIGTANASALVANAQSGTYEARLCTNVGGVGYSLWTDSRAYIGGDLTVTGNLTVNGTYPGGGGSSTPLATTAPANLGSTAAVGISTSAARADHVHKLPTATDIGAAAVSHTHSGYAAVDHTHTSYALSSHTHTGYASSSHTHKVVDISDWNTNTTVARAYEVKALSGTTYMRGTGTGDHIEIQSSGSAYQFRRGGVVWSFPGNTSDRRLKTNIINSVSPGIETINALRVVDFEWRPHAGEYDGGLTHTGFIAQEVQSVIPEAVHEGNDTLFLYKERIVPYLVKAVQELHAEVQSLKQQLQF